MVGCLAMVPAWHEKPSFHPFLAGVTPTNLGSVLSLEISIPEQSGPQLSLVVGVVKIINSGGTLSKVGIDELKFEVII